MPLATIHFAGAERSCADTHSSRFLPSNKMIASEGGAAQVAPGVTTFGSGCQTSVSSGLAVDCWARRETAMAPRIMETRIKDTKSFKAKSFHIGERMMSKSIHLNT